METVVFPAANWRLPMPTGSTVQDRSVDTSRMRRHPASPRSLRLQPTTMTIKTKIKSCPLWEASCTKDKLVEADATLREEIAIGVGPVSAVTTTVGTEGFRDANSPRVKPSLFVETGMLRTQNPTNFDWACHSEPLQLPKVCHLPKPPLILRAGSARFVEREKTPTPSLSMTEREESPGRNSKCPWFETKSFEKFDAPLPVVTR
mmetsp:Transcript_44572/g.144768  ORF Transcript_44572/g.144768 Transcript_44572/m.144768 type:complete len:204 (+) Transcript_44572:600-1211(+)